MALASWRAKTIGGKRRVLLETSDKKFTEKGSIHGPRVLHFAPPDVTLNNNDDFQTHIVNNNFDCVINSACNELLTPGVSGTAKSLLNFFGQDMIASSKDLVETHGEVKKWTLKKHQKHARVWRSIKRGRAITEYVGHKGVGSLTHIIHAVTVKYEREGSSFESKTRVPTPREIVGLAFYNAIIEASLNGCRRVWARVMCAREGYTTVKEAADEPGRREAVMMRTMERAAQMAAQALNSKGERMPYVEVFRVTKCPFNINAYASDV